MPLSLGRGWRVAPGEGLTLYLRKICNTVERRTDTVQQLQTINPQRRILGVDLAVGFLVRILLNVVSIVA